MDLRVRLSIRRERLPRPGPRARRWAWEDVLEEPPPWRASPLARAYVVRHGHEEPDTTARVGYATVVSLRPDGAVEVDEQITLEPRVLAPVLHAEDVVARRLARTSRAGLHLVARGSVVLSRRVGGRSGAALETGTGAFVQSLRWAGRLVRDTIHAAVEAPDRFWRGATSAEALLGHRRERRALLRGLASPGSLSAEGKTAAVFLVLALLLFVVIAGTFYVVFVRPEMASAWRTSVAFFAQALVGTVLLPLFPELQLPAAIAAIGLAPAILLGATAMTTGAYLTLFVGEAFNGALRRSVRGSPQLARWLDKAEALAARYGFWVAFLVLSIPLGPDTPVFYTLATARTPLPKYLLGAFLGTTLRFALYALVVSRRYVA